MLKLPHNCTHLTWNKVMLKILQARLQQHVKHWTSRCSSWFWKRQRNERSNYQHPLDHQKSERVPEKTSTSALLTKQKPLTVWTTTNWKILKEMGIPDPLTCLLWNLYAGQEATVRTGRGTTDWFQIRKGVSQGCILSPCLFNLYAECIMRNGGLDEASAGVKSASRNINNLRFADDTTLNGRKWRRTKEPLDESETREWKSWLKAQLSEN